VASASWAHVEPISSIPMRKTGTVRIALTTKRRRMSMSSWFGPSSSEGASGSRAMPHFGHAPGPSWRTSGCIGHTYQVPAGAAGGGVTGDNQRAGSATNFSRHFGLQNQ
jgi:hypothetical protein